MNRTNIKGSITVEAIVMLGLIATLTPILYKHVAERRQDIENINEANTLLLLKNATAEYIEANKNALTVGTIVLEPADIGVDISGYQIGIRKDSDGMVNAMIASSDGGNDDMKAAKVASLLGLSAGIYSAQNMDTAWGINGVWAEDISNYGFTSLPTGIPVITTAYDKEDASGLNEEQLKDFIENTVFDKVTAKQFCIDNSEIPEEQRCIDLWQFEKCSELIGQCDLGNKCNDAYNKRCNQTCDDILISYRTEGSFPTSDYAFRLTGSNPNGETNKTKCYFTSSAGYNAVELIEACNAGNNDACSLANTYSLNTTCQKIMDTYQSLSQTPNNETYKLGAGTDTACWFKNSTGYSTKEVIEKCNSGTALACQMGEENKLNRTCAEVQTSMKSYGTTPANASYKLTLTSANGSAYTCDMSQTPAWTQVFISSVDGASYTAPYTASYGLACAGGAGDTYTASSGGKGGIVSGIAQYSAGTIFKIAIKKGGTYWNNASLQSGGSGIGIYLSSTYSLAALKIVAGGGGGAWGDGGGSGWGGGGTSLDNTISFSQGFYANGNKDIGQAGGGNGGCPTYPGTPYGGDGSGCISFSNDPGAGGGSGYCSLNNCKEELPYGISRKLPHNKPSSGNLPSIPPEAAVYIIELSD